MNLDLLTNSAAIKNSITSLTNGKISWIVLGYSGNNTLNVIDTGDDSFEDMFEAFDSNKIMYGFAAVTDPNTKLKKNVFIYWQGEAASQSMKTITVQHSNIIRDLCKPIHVTHNARDEQDLDLKEIMTKVASASGSNYSCHNETKQVFQHTASVKSEENTASNLRQNRLKELSALGSIQKESVPLQKIGSSYEKVDATKEIKNLRSTKFEGSNPPKPKVFAKGNTNQQIKPSYTSQQEKVSGHSDLAYNKGTNYTKIDASKEIRAAANNTAPQSTNTGYKKINPEQELKSLNFNQKSAFEGKIKVQSENNTAQKAKEERQKELSTIFNRKITCDDGDDQKVGTNYTKVNPLADIKKLRSASITHDDDVFPNPTSNYKKIDPSVEIQKLRGQSTSEVSEPTSPSSHYKKINPAEEIKKLKSQSTFSDEQPSNQGYKKINPKEEINNARKLTTPFVNTDNIRIEEKHVHAEVRTSMLSARQSFENAHKVNHDVHQPHKFQPTTQNSFQEESKASVDIKKVEIVRPPPPILSETRKVADNVNMVHILPKEITHDDNQLKNTAEAQFTYEATDTDEISFEGGEIIREIEIIDEDWWIGINASGKKGMFPSNYVMPHDIKRPTKDDNHVEKVQIVTDIKVPSVDKRLHIDTKESLTAVAIYDYQANDCDEISFDVNDIIKEIEQVDEGWWVGINPAGKKGMFPSNFVELTSLKQEVEAKSPTVDEYNNPSPQKLVEDSVKVQALFDYIAQDEDELSFITGDMIYNVSTVDEGWWEGELANGKRGLFPSNYVEMV